MQNGRRIAPEEYEPPSRPASAAPRLKSRPLSVPIDYQASAYIHADSTRIGLGGGTTQSSCAFRMNMSSTSKSELQTSGNQHKPADRNFDFISQQGGPAFRRTSLRPSSALIVEPDFGIPEVDQSSINSISIDSKIKIAPSPSPKPSARSGIRVGDSNPLAPNHSSTHEVHVPTDLRRKPSIVISINPYSSNSSVKMRQPNKQHGDNHRRSLAQYEPPLSMIQVDESVNGHSAQPDNLLSASHATADFSCINNVRQELHRPLSPAVTMYPVFSETRSQLKQILYAGSVNPGVIRKLGREVVEQTQNILTTEEDAIFHGIAMVRFLIKSDCKLT